ncbi:LOW QUALITY PROTEIN: uncharacterized protein [Panulirus ornatus]|uniref:LOW QUALITY PROTEIN: uncharacterized protein n=1 Tax=Panulirus ornatus TaxID=150431 RepID=UPI003A8BD811
MCPASVCCECVTDNHLGTETTNTSFTGYVTVVATGRCDGVEYMTDTATPVPMKTDDADEGRNDVKENRNLDQKSCKQREQISSFIENINYDLENLSDQFRNVNVRRKDVGNLHDPLVKRGNFSRASITHNATSITSNIADISKYTSISPVRPQGVQMMGSLTLQTLCLTPSPSWKAGTHTDEEPQTSLTGLEAPQCVRGLVMSECDPNLGMSQNKRGPGTSSGDQGPLMSVCFIPVTSFGSDVFSRPTSVSSVVMSPGRHLTSPPPCVASSSGDHKDWPSPRDEVSGPSCVMAPSEGFLVSAPDRLSSPPAEGLVLAPSGLTSPTGSVVSSAGGQRSLAEGVVSSPDGQLPPPLPPVRLVSAHPAGRTTAPAVGGKIGRILKATLLFLTVIFASPVAGRYDRGGPQHSITWGRGNSHNSAVFGNLPTNITAVLGHRARLPCQVKNLGLKDVSWIRKRDLHILTVGIFTYTTDDRFTVYHPLDAENWFLDISSVTFRDAGVYECQVSTSPKVSLPIHLTVLAVQQAEILGPSEVYIQHGSTISLHCEVEAGVEAVGPVLWYEGASTLNYSSPRGGISMEVEKTPTKTMSKLYITRAVRQDSGNYTCAPKFALPDSVIVHVVNAGEESAAAVQSGVEAARACMDVVWAAVGVLWAITLLAAWLTPIPTTPTCRP